MIPILLIIIKTLIELKTNTKILKYISLIFIIIYNHASIADSKSPKLITACEVINTTYVQMVPYDDSLIKKSTNYSSKKGKVKEYYFLVSEEGTNEENINIYYKSITNSFFQFNTHEEIKQYGGKFEILNRDPFNLVVRVYYPQQSEHVYYFNLNEKLEGHMSLMTTKYKSFLNAANNQSLFFCKCSRDLKKITPPYK